MRVQRYIKEQIPYMIRRTKEFCEQSPLYSMIQFNAEKMEFILNSNITNSLFHCDVVVNEDDPTNTPIGGMGAQLFSFAMSHSLYSDDMFLFVVPEARGYGAADMLVKAYKEWAFSRKVIFARITYTAMVNPEGFAKLMERNNFEVMGQMYLCKGPGQVFTPEQQMQTMRTRKQ